MANTYEVGDVVRVTTVFTNQAGTAIDPTSVTGKYKDPSGNITTNSSPTKSATGTYYFDVEVDESGIWYYEMTGATGGGGNQGASQGYFIVRDSEFD